MSDKEREEIIQEVMARLAVSEKRTNARSLDPTLAKWFRDGRGSATDSLMGKALGGGVAAYSIWELVRRATCRICGAQYVHQIKDAKRANEVADKICQTIYDLAMEGKKKWAT